MSTKDDQHAKKRVYNLVMHCSQEKCIRKGDCAKYLPDAQFGHWIEAGLFPATGCPYFRAKGREIPDTCPQCGRKDPHWYQSWDLTEDILKCPECYTTILTVPTGRSRKDMERRWQRDKKLKAPPSKQDTRSWATVITFWAVLVIAVIFLVLGVFDGFD